MRAALIAWKYRGDLGAGDALRALFARWAASSPLRADLVAPVPATRARRVSRGFEPASLLALSAARAGGLPLARLVERREHARSQAMLDRIARFDSVRGSFRAVHPDAVRDRGILLVDDVLTSGATSEECARTLVSAGARRVDLLVLARAAGSNSKRTLVESDDRA